VQGKRQDAGWNKIDENEQYTLLEVAGGTGVTRRRDRRRVQNVYSWTEDTNVGALGGDNPAYSVRRRKRMSMGS